MTISATESLTQVQAAARLLEAIASDIDRIKGLLHADDSIINNTTVTVVESLGRLGWLAECGAVRLGEAVTTGGADPLGWMAGKYVRDALQALGPQ